MKQSLGKSIQQILLCLAVHICTKLLINHTNYSYKFLMQTENILGLDLILVKHRGFGFNYDILTNIYV
jgi:hypothetical protein